MTAIACQARPNSPLSSSASGPSSRTVASRRVVSSVSTGSISTSAALTTKCRPPSAVTTIRSAAAASGTAILTPRRSAPSEERSGLPSVSSSHCATVPRRPPSSRSGLAGGVEQQRRRPGRRQRRRRARVAELLGHHRQLDDAEPGLRHRQLGPAEPHDLVPLRVGEPALLLQREPPDLLELVAGAEELARGALDVLLVLGEVEVHFDRGSPSTRSATMFLRISVVPPSIELARARR